MKIQRFEIIKIDSDVYSVQFIQVDFSLLKASHKGRTEEIQITTSFFVAMTRELINAAISAEDLLALSTQLQGVKSAAYQSLDIAKIFPTSLASNFKERARTLPCDPLAYILPTLACVASIVGTRVSFKAKDGFKQRPVVFGINMMPPSSMKSVILNDVVGPVIRLEKEARKATKASNQATGIDGRSRRYVTDNITHASLVSLLCRDETIGLIAACDELSQLFHQLTAMHNLGMRAELLKLWSGQAVLKDTESNGGQFADKTAFSIVGNIPNEEFSKILGNEKGFGEQGGDGFWLRWLIVSPRVIPYVFIDDGFDIEDVLYSFYSCLDSIDEDVELELSRGARMAFADQVNLWGKSHELYSDLENNFINKQRGHLLRIAGILHLMDLACSECANGRISLGDYKISKSAMDRAISFIEYCHAQWKMLIEPVHNSGLQSFLVKLMARIYKEEAKLKRHIEEVTVREIQRWKILSNASSKEIASKLNQITESYQLGMLAKKPNGGVVWKVPTKTNLEAFFDRIVNGASNS